MIDPFNWSLVAYAGLCLIGFAIGCLMPRSRPRYRLVTNEFEIEASSLKDFEQMMEAIAVYRKETQS